MWMSLRVLVFFMPAFEQIIIAGESHRTGNIDAAMNS